MQKIRSLEHTARKKQREWWLWVLRCA